MLRTAHILTTYLLLSTGILISSCSAQEEPENEQYLQTQEENYSEDDAWNPAEDGYRRARMVVTFLIEQEGVLHEVDNSRPGDPVTTDIDWHFRLSAKRELDVWVLPDLRFLFPESADIETQLEWLRSEPYFEVEPDATQDDSAYDADDQPIINAEGTIAFSSEFRYARPNAADAVLTERVANATGRPVRLAIKHMEPSMLGEGYEVTLQITEDYTGEAINTLTYRDGRVDSFTDVLAPDEDRTIKFVPALKQGPVMPYPMEGEQALPEIAAKNREIMNEMLAGLRQANFAEKLLAGIIAGLKTTDSKDALILHYRNDGGEGIPMFYAGTELLAAPLSKNLIDFKIQFTLDQ